jgi:hypothetical protein
MAAYSDWTLNLTGAGSPERVQGAVVSATFFQVLGVRADIGRTFAPDEDTPGQPTTSSSSGTVSSRQFESDRSLVGRPITLDGKSFHRHWRRADQFGCHLRQADFFLPVSLVCSRARTVLTLLRRRRQAEKGATLASAIRLGDRSPADLTAVEPGVGSFRSREIAGAPARLSCSWR